MIMSSLLKPEIKKLLMEGTVIPAHPLALTRERTLDERRQRALTRYYADSGAGGIAVGVHTTQFEIRDHHINLLETVLRMAAEETSQLNRPFIKVAGICGDTDQALYEAELARDLGYDLGLLSMGGLAGWPEEKLLERAEKVAQVIPVFGFYLQPSVGGRVLSYEFWRKFAEIPNVHAIKIAPFNRYQTLDVMRAVCESSRNDEIAVYTGNDDNIVADLLTTYRFNVDGAIVEKQIAGGLLGHWAVWTKQAVDLLACIKQERQKPFISRELLTKGMEITDCNAAFFDPSHDFKGCISGIHEVLRRQGLLEGIWCLNEAEGLSHGQNEEISRVYRQYPHLNDDEFVQENLGRWLGNKNE